MLSVRRIDKGNHTAKCEQVKPPPVKSRDFAEVGPSLQSPFGLITMPGNDLFQVVDRRRILMKSPARNLIVVVISLLMPLGCGGDATPVGPSSSGPAKAVKFVGFDMSVPLIQGLREGQIQGLVLQNPYRMGWIGVGSLVKHLEGESVEPNVPTGETLMTLDNFVTPEIQDLLNAPKTEHSKDSNLSGGERKKWRLMVIPKGTMHDHWKAVHAGASDAAAKLGNVEIIWQGPTREDERADQIKLVQNAIATKVDGIVIAPLDSRALVAPIEQAAAAGIPSVIIDSDLNSTKKVAYVATDNYHGGVLGARRLGELLGGNGKIILLRYAVGSQSTEERERGFVDTITKEYPNIVFIEKDQYAGATADSAQRVAQTLTVKYRGQVDGIFCPNESSTLGMLRALKDAGMLATP
jgi:ribose transport system substrate-binding protein